MSPVGLQPGSTRPPNARQPPPAGWDVGCLCGWAGGNHPTREPAQLAYRAHLDQLIDQGLFRCKRCGTDKRAGQMRPDYRYICLVCFSQIGNDWQRRNPDAAAAHKRRHHLLKAFGITPEEADELLARQGGLCAICRAPIRDSRGFSPHVDHDHETGRVRGILCFHCNAGLGQFRDDPDRLRAALAYLESEPDRCEP